MASNGYFVCAECRKQFVTKVEWPVVECCPTPPMCERCYRAPVRFGGVGSQRTFSVDDDPDAYSWGRIVRAYEDEG